MFICCMKQITHDSRCAHGHIPARRYHEPRPPHTLYLLLYCRLTAVVIVAKAHGGTKLMKVDAHAPHLKPQASKRGTHSDNINPATALKEGLNVDNVDL